MTDFAYRLEEPHGPALGLIVLRVDETIEHEIRGDIPREAARLFVSRLASGDDLTPDSIAAMEAGLRQAAALLPEAAGLDVVGYGCTSATALIGAARVHAQIRAGVETGAVTDPLTAATAYFRALGLRRIGVVSPYVPPVAEPLCAAFAGQGFEVAGTLSFGEKSEARVARIAPGSVAEAARALFARCRPEALFLSCTNLRTAGILAPLQAELGLPVQSSNRALAWHMRQLAGLVD